METNEIEKVVTQLAKKADQDATDQLIEAQIKIMAASYDKAIAYTNLLIVAGYACFFGMWKMTENYLSKGQILWSALLMTTSAIIFVFFEVTKTFYSSRQLQKLNSIVTNEEINSSFQKLHEAFAEYNKKVCKHVVVWGYWWSFSWIATVLFGLSAVGILVWAFVNGIINP
jgi:hypothetical protein